MNKEIYENLLERAKDAREKSYSPYSHYRVGAALLCKDGNVYTGTNIENAAYTPTVCAERVAFFKAVSEGEKEFSAIMVVGGKESIESCTPCGVCRQVMAEFCDKENFEIVYLENGEIKTKTLKEIFPDSFSPLNLK